MATTAPGIGRHRQAHCHPAVYRSMAGLATLMVLASAAFFADGGPGAYLYAVIAGFVLGSLGLPWLIRRVRRRDSRPWRDSTPPAHSGESFTSFASGDFAAGRIRITGR